MARLTPRLQRSSEPAAPRERNNLYEPGDDLSERSDYPFTLKRSAYTRVMMHPIASTVSIGAALTLGLIAFAAYQASSGSARRT